MMTVKDFINTTLDEIVTALLDFEAKHREQERGITAFPNLTPKPNEPSQLGTSDYLMGVQFAMDDDGKPITGSDGTSKFLPHVVMPVEFDIAVTATSEEATAIGGGIRVLEIFKVNGDFNEKEAQSSVSRVKFKIPLQLARGA